MNSRRFLLLIVCLYRYAKFLESSIQKFVKKLKFAIKMEDFIFLKEDHASRLKIKKDE